MLVYRRPANDGATVAERAIFRPFLWMAGEQEGLPSEPLAGGLVYDRLVRCADWSDFQAARNDLRTRRESNTLR